MENKNLLRFCTYSLCLVVLLASESKAQNVTTISVTDTSTSSNSSTDFEDDLNDQKYPYVVSLKFHIKEELFPLFITDVAMGEIPCTVTDCPVSLIDIAEAIQISTYSNQDLAGAIERLNISTNDAYNMLLLYPITPTYIEQFLKMFGLQFSEIYKNFVDSLVNPSEVVPEILTIVNVSVPNFINAQTYGNDTQRLQVLSTGNYSLSNIQSVLNITNKTAADMLKLIPLNAIAKQITKFDKMNFTNFFKNLGVTSLNFMDFYKHLNVTIIHFLTSPAFLEVLSNYYAYLNPVDILGVIISDNVIVTSNEAEAWKMHQDITTHPLRRYFMFYAEVLQNPLVQYVVNNVSLSFQPFASTHLAKVQIQGPIASSFAELSNTTILKNCTYVSILPLGGPYYENISNVSIEKDDIVIVKSNATIYNIGSPLICQDKVQGVAIANEGSRIKFASLKKNGFSPSILPKPTGSPHKPTSAGTGGNGTDSHQVTPHGSGSSSIVMNCSLFTIIIMGFVAYFY